MMNTSSAGAITWLFVPGDRPDRFEKARRSGADEVICDLEDAVGAGVKDRARTDVVNWLADSGEAWVRINAPETPWHAADIAALAGLRGLRGIVVPKAESATALRLIGETANACLIALIESAAGIHHAHQIAGVPAVVRLAFGPVDYALDIDAEESDESLLLARSALVLASRVAGQLAPVDGATMNLADTEQVRLAALRARRLGFGGKLCVHPRQIAPAAAGFQPTDEQVEWAHRVLRQERGHDGGARVKDGLMVDKPVVERARRIIRWAPARSQSYGGTTDYRYFVRRHKTPPSCPVL